MKKIFIKKIYHWKNIEGDGIDPRAKSVPPNMSRTMNENNV